MANPWTPGPWRGGIAGNFRIYAPDGLGEESGLIFTAFGSRARANINLAIAAPDMADLLEQWLTGKSASPTATVDATRALLASIRGEA